MKASNPNDSTKEDFSALVCCGLHFGNEKAYNPDYLRNTFIPLLIDSGIVLVSSDKDGAILGTVSPHPYNPDYLVATEFMWWVKEDKRNSSIGYRLLKEFEAFAKEAGADVVAMTLMANSPVTSFEKRGYIMKEMSFIKEI